MKEVDLYIERYRWQVRFFFPVSGHDIAQILTNLVSIDCPIDTLVRCAVSILDDDLDTGFTFSNKDDGRSVCVIGRSSTPREFLNSFQHELRHLVDHIADARSLRSSGEKVAYLTGELNWELWPDIHNFICCHE